ncbi:MAG: DNA mismatch repair protein MutS [Prevotella sp.]|jgi:DNA mismatch repair protein MutS2|nr:DNA mismatch repair protein MutS [Prevotella sp.]
MIYPDNFEQRIGIDTVRQYITEKCLSTLGEEQVTNMSLSTNYATIAEWLEQTKEFTQIIRSNEDFPVDCYLDVRDSLLQIKEDVTTWLPEEEIANLMNSLQTINNIVAFLHKSKTDTGRAKYPALSLLANSIKVFPSIIERAGSILDKSCQVKDNASRRLSDIRRDKAEANKAVIRNIQNAIRDAQKAGLVGRDAQISIRDGHMVIPVDAANKRKIKGRIHDGSGSGKTVFIEPEEVSEVSSRLRELEADERREVIKILIGFTDLVRPHIADLVLSYDFLGKIDFIRAKALFAIRISGIKPIFEDKQQIEWVQAIHPLLNIQLFRENKRAFPLDIRLDKKDRLLIVSGANAGGKSLCLKTVALLQYMLQCGLLIPVQSNSRTGVFEHIFVDIGDGQSIENSLSTYTSHLTNMKFFVENCNNKTLILIDEFGSGTEPQIGGAIAETLLDRFNSRYSFGVITTHFQNLKHFAYKTDGVINGAMLYDVEHMNPLYRLSIGSPGSSFAVEVARRIGLAEDIIVDSSAKIGEDFINMDNFLQSITRDKLYWEDKRKELENVKEQVDNSQSDKEEPDKPIIEQLVKSTTIEKGDSVRLNGQSVVGTVLELQGKQATIAFGSIKSSIAINRLELVSKAK